MIREIQKVPRPLVYFSETLSQDIYMYFSAQHISIGPATISLYLSIRVYLCFLWRHFQCRVRLLITLPGARCRFRVGVFLLSLSLILRLFAPLKFPPLHLKLSPGVCPLGKAGFNFFYDKQYATTTTICCDYNFPARNNVATESTRATRVPFFAGAFLSAAYPTTRSGRRKIALKVKKKSSL